MDPKMEKELAKLGGGDIMAGADVDPKAIEAIMQEVYGSIGKEVPKEATSSNPLAGIDLTPDPNLVQETALEKAEKLAEAKKSFQEGQKFANAAVKFDEAERYGVAGVAYDKAITNFSKALDLGFPRKEEYRVKLFEQIVGYIERLQEICLSSGDKTLKLKKSTKQICAVTAIYQERRTTFKILANEGFQLLSRALDLKKRAKEYEIENKRFEAFVLYQECLDCLLAYNDTSERVKNDEGTKKTISKLILEILDKAEGIKKDL